MKSISESQLQCFRDLLFKLQRRMIEWWIHRSAGWKFPSENCFVARPKSMKIIINQTIANIAEIIAHHRLLFTSKCICALMGINTMSTLTTTESDSIENWDEYNYLSELHIFRYSNDGSSLNALKIETEKFRFEAINVWKVFSFFFYANSVIVFGLLHLIFPSRLKTSENNWRHKLGKSFINYIVLTISLWCDVDADDDGT